MTIAGWADYMDPGVLDDFTKQTGITVFYDNIQSATALAKQLAEGGAGYDIVMLSQSLLAAEIAAGSLQKLDMAKLPASRNLDAGIMAKLASYDAGHQYAVPYLWFTLGIGYNPVKAKERLGDAAAQILGSWGAVFRPEILKKFADCGVAFLDDQHAMFSAALLALKLDPETESLNDLKKASDLLLNLRRAAKTIAPDSTAAALASAGICLSIDQSAAIEQAQEQAQDAGNEGEAAFSLPREGAPVFIDTLAIPKDAPHAAEAHRFIDFLLRPDSAARNSAATHFATPVSAAKPLIDAAIAENKAIYPDAAALARLAALRRYDPAAQKWIDREWQRIKAAK